MENALASGVHLLHWWCLFRLYRTWIQKHPQLCSPIPYKSLSVTHRRDGTFLSGATRRSGARKNWNSEYFKIIETQKMKYLLPTSCTKYLCFWMWELYFSRRREHVCSFWDYNYVGTSKELYPEWNSRLINFVPFLCSLTLEILDILRDICLLESTSSLLFQQSREKIVQVSIDLSMFKHVGIRQFNQT